MTKTIIIDDAIPFAKEMFAPLGKVICLAGSAITAEKIIDADALIIRSRTNINKNLLKHSKVSFIGSTVVGLDHVDQQYLIDNNIQFYSAQGSNANSVAEYVITCIINHVQQHNISLTGKTLGIIGVGNIGKLLQTKAIALGLKILANDPLKQVKKDDKNFVDLNTALSADIISFHTPLQTSTKHPTNNLLNKKNFPLINKQALLINASRGGIINEIDWIEYANKHPNITNIIDCWQNEPNINQQLQAIAHIATPHIAGHALDAKIKGALMTYKNLCNFWQQPINNDWQTLLPKTPTISIKTTGPTQQIIYDLIKQCYQPQKDHQAMQLNNNFEHYRRNYPTRREWSKYSLKKSTDINLNQALTGLGFKLL